VNQLLVTLYLYVFPAVAVASTAILAALWLLLPGSAKTLLRARLSRSGSLVLLCDDDGYARLELMKEAGMGVLRGNPTSYVFTPRPAKIGEAGDVGEAERAVLEEAILHRHFTDCGKPLYIGYVGDSVAVTPRLLKLMREAGEGAGEDPQGVELLDPRVIRSYLKYSFSPQLIDALALAHEQMAELRKPASTALKIAIPATAILIAIIVAYMLLQGGGFSFSFMR